VHVQEWFSLTCTHCARFDLTVFPDVKAKLIDTGKVYYVYNDFPLDRVALMAAMVARALPPDRYEPFVDSLFASQDRWAFAPGVDSKAVLQQMAELAGMPAATFDATVSDTAFQSAIIANQDAAQKRYNIDSTPTFIFNHTPVKGEMTFDMFAQQVKNVTG
jgi:protein-disulfide isomerase